MKQTQEKPHKFDIGEGYGIWTDLDGTTQRSFPEEFLRAKSGDSAGQYKIGDLAIMNQPSYKKRYGMFVIANVETGDFGGSGLKYRITVKPDGTVEDLARGDSASRGGAERRRELARGDSASRGGAERRREEADSAAKNARDAKDLEKTTMKKTTYKMMKIRLADCTPHADAEAYSASTEDRAALANSVAEAGVLSPIAVIPGESGGVEECGSGGVKKTHNSPTHNSPTQRWYVIDGIGRMNALIEAGVEETEAQVFDLGDLSVAEFVVCKNSMMRKVTTGTRVMAYLKCHEREVLAAADPAHYSLRGRDAKGRIAKLAVSHETAGDKGWGAKEIAERIGVSKNDVLAGIELLKATVESGGVVSGGVVSGGVNSQLITHNSQTYEQGDLFETMEAVLRGETPIRRWKAAVCGKMPKTGGKAAADYTAIAIRTVKSLPGVWQHWQEVPMEVRGPIIAEFRQSLKWLPEDFRAVLEEEILSHAEARSRRGQRR